VVEVHTAEGHSDDWDFEALWTELKTLYPVGLTVDEVLTEAGSRGKVTQPFLTKEILSDAKFAYDRRTETLGEPAMRELERRVVLSVIDRRWRDHLYEMDYLKDGIGLRAMAQRDPLVEYQREGFSLYQNMMGSIREESVGFLFNLEVEVSGGVGSSSVDARGLNSPTGPAQGLSYSAPNADASGEVEVRNQRGQVEGAATAAAQAKQATVNPAFGRPPGQQPQQPAAQQGGGEQRGAFGQRTAAPTPPPANRAERRAQEKRK
jgi:preprotein translocase subunit SecA